MRPPTKDMEASYSKAQIKRGRAMMARAMLTDLQSHGATRSNPLQASENLVPKALSSGLLLFPHFDPSVEKSTVAQLTDWLGFQGVSMTAAKQKAKDVEKEAWALYEKVWRAYAVEDLSTINLLCVEAEAKKMSREIKARRRAGITRVTWDVKPVGYTGVGGGGDTSTSTSISPSTNHSVKIVKAAKADVPGQDDIQPSKRAQVIQLVVELSSVQRMTARDRRGEVVATTDHELVKDYFVMEKLTDMPPYVYRGWRIVTRYEEGKRMGKGKGVSYADAPAEAHEEEPARR
jgi:hypothetical protein